MQQPVTLTIHPVLISSLRTWAADRKDHLIIAIHHDSKSPLRDVQENLPALVDALHQVENFLQQLNS